MATLMSLTCPSCGQSLAQDSAYCTSCGQAVSAEPVDDGVYWSAEFPLVTSRFFLRDMVKFVALTFLVLVGVSLLMSVAAGNDFSDGLIMIPIWGVGVMGLALLVFIIALVVLGNRAGALYRMDEQGLAVVQRSKAQPLNELSQWLGILSGSGQLWASGILAQAQERVYLRWRSVHGYRLYPADRVIELDDAFHTALRVYCPEEVYVQLAARLQARPAPAGAGKGQGIRRILGWLVLTLVATLLGLCWEPRVNDVGFMVVLTGMFVFISGLLPGMLHRGLGLFGLLSGLPALGHRVLHLVDPSVWSIDDEFWPAGFATLGCAGLVLLALYQMFRQERPGDEMVMFDEDLNEG